MLSNQASGEQIDPEVMLQRNRAAADFDITAEIARSQSSAFNMNLRAKPRANPACAVVVAVPIAPEYMPVLFLPPQQIFWSAATQMMKAETEIGDASETIDVTVAQPKFGDAPASKETGQLVQNSSGRARAGRSGRECHAPAQPQR